MAFICPLPSFHSSRAALRSATATKSPAASPAAAASTFFALWDAMSPPVSSPTTPASVPRDLVSYNLAAEACAALLPPSEAPRRCEAIKGEMEAAATARGDASLLPDANTYTSLLKALSRAGAEEAAVTSTVVPVGSSRRTGTAVAAAGGGSELAARVRRVAREVSEGYETRGGVPSPSPAPTALRAGPCLDLPLRSALIEALCAVGEPEEGLLLLNRWVRDGHPPRKYAYLQLMRAFADRGQAYLAEQLAERASGRRGECAGRALTWRERGQLQQLSQQSGTPAAAAAAART
jgi:pentatricopeptide repeat protein